MEGLKEKTKERMFEHYLYDNDVIVKDYLDTKSMKRITNIWDRKSGKEIDMEEEKKWDLVSDLVDSWSETTEEGVDKMVKELKKKD